MRTLAMQASNDTNTASDRANLNDELTDLQAEITRIAETATFNNQNLLEGTMSGSVYQVGHKAGETVALSIADFSADAIGYDGGKFDITAAAKTGDAIKVSVAGTDVTHTVASATAAALTASAVAANVVTTLNADSTFSALYTASVDSSDDSTVSITRKSGSDLDGSVLKHSDVTTTVTTVNSGTLTAGSVSGSGTFLNATSVTTRANAQAAVKVIDYALDLVSKERANLGAFQNRLEHAVSNMMNMSANTSDARSVIADADYAQESSALAKNQILQQAGTAMLAQANAQSQTVLSLLK